LLDKSFCIRYIERATPRTVSRETEGISPWNCHGVINLSTRRRALVAAVTRVGDI
jgi:hypothetical protein